MTAAAKTKAAAAALELVEDGMRLGLGSGSTAMEFVRLLGDRGFSGVCVATSEATAELAEACGLTLTALDSGWPLDLAVDGADEIDPGLNLIKGGGGAHLREKIVATAARRFVVIADASKRVERLGRFPLPIEVSAFGWSWTAERIKQAAGLSAPLRLRRTADDRPFLTDGGNLILDAPMGAIEDPAALSATLDAIPGVIEHGLFVGLAECAFLADETAVTILR